MWTLQTSKSWLWSVKSSHNLSEETLFFCLDQDRKTDQIQHFPLRAMQSVSFTCTHIHVMNIYNGQILRKLWKVVWVDSGEKYNFTFLNTRGQAYSDTVREISNYYENYFNSIILSINTISLSLYICTKKHFLLIYSSGHLNWIILLPVYEKSDKHLRFWSIFRFFQDWIGFILFCYSISEHVQDTLVNKQTWRNPLTIVM